jgi:hypothetical protein
VKACLLLLCCAAAALAALPATAQLAITEVMSWASQNPAGETYPDYWELTNFGANTIDLTGYSFTDDAGAEAGDPAIFEGAQIGPGESIIFMRKRDRDIIQTIEEFRAWWGETNLPPSLQVIFYPRPGFSSDKDEVQLWQVTATGTNLVDRVTFDEATRGFAFTYDPETGALDSLSEPGVDCAFRAASSADVGSPGCTTGPVPLTILEQPKPVSVDAGTPAIFNVRAQGLPRPKFQWLFNGVPIPGATERSLTIEQAASEHAGAYSVELVNGLQVVLSASAILEVNTSPSCARIEAPPSNISVTTGQTAIFTVGVRGYPLPSIQWYFEGEPIPGATDATLAVFHADCNSAGAYNISVTNPLCSAEATALLKVTRKPRLAITEVMTSISANAALLGFREWWELTNFDDYSVNLRGYRWDDSPSVLEGAFTITEDVVAQPGESIIFAQRMTREEFIDWWGAENLPENLQVIRYTGNSLSAAGDSIRLWNATATDRDDYIDSLGFVHLNEDFTSIRGFTRTFWCDGLLEFGQPSVLGECGAFQAARSEDIGSPGYATRFSSRGSAPRILQISRDAEGVHLTFETQSGRPYELQYKNSLSDPGWNVLSGQLGTGARLSLSDGLAPGAGQRFYRLVRLSQLPCHE